MQPSSHTANVFNNLKIISGSKWPTSNYTISYIVRIGTFKKLIVANSWYMEHLRSRRRWTTGSATFTDNLYPGKLAPAFARWKSSLHSFLASDKLHCLNSNQRNCSDTSRCKPFSDPCRVHQPTNQPTNSPMIIDCFSTSSK